MAFPQIGQVSSSTPFNSSTGRGFSSTDVQGALEELRDHTVYISETTALSASGTLTLTSSNKNLQFLTGSASGFSVKLPDATTVPVSSLYQVINTTNNTVDIKDASNTLLFTLSQNSIGYCYLQLNGTAAGTWVYWQILSSSTASGIINYKLTSSTAFATTSATDVVITSFTITPQAGTYAVWVSLDIQLTVNNSLGYCTIYKAGSAITDSQRETTVSGSNVLTHLQTLTTTQVDGTQAIDVRVRRSTGTFTINNRTIVLIRLGP